VTATSVAGRSPRGRLQVGTSFAPLALFGVPSLARRLPAFSRAAAPTPRSTARSPLPPDSPRDDARSPPPERAGAPLDPLDADPPDERGAA
jgi:hypothetical protein